MRTALENLLFQSGLNQKEFAQKVGVKYETFKKQLTSKKKHVQLAYDYAIILGVSEVSGYDSGVYFELVIPTKKPL